MTMPPYTLRYSQKAKYLQLRVSTGGVEVVVPHAKRVSQTVIEQFLQQKKAWILRHWQRVAQVQETQVVQLPERIVFRAMEQTWNVIYLGMDVPHVRCTTNLSRQIILLGNIANQTHCLKLLRQWLKKIAKQHLEKPLRQLALEHGLSFGELKVRHTITRWGSCGSNKNISLCCKLLFLPPHLVRHVLLHELCHTKVMSHGVRFWKLLRKLDPDCDLNRSQLKKAGDYVPGWAK